MNFQTRQLITKNLKRLRFVIIPFLISIRYRIIPLKDKISVIKVKTNGIKFLMKIDTDGRGKFPIINTRLLRVLGIYEPETSRVLFTETKKGDTILEIGAAYGYFTTQFSKLVGESGQVISIEPLSHENSVFTETVKINNLKNVKLINKALVPKSKAVDFLVPFETVHIQDLISTLKLNSLDFIFIDIDAPSRSGDELRQEEDLLKCIIPVLNELKWHPKIFLEYVEKGEQLENIIGFLKSFNYQVKNITDRHYLFIKNTIQNN